MTDERSKRNIRHGYTLIEFMVSMVSATLLLAGLASCLFIALRAFDGSSAAAVRSRAAEVQAEMLVDLGEATSFSNRSTDSVTFKVPDRDGDGNEETIAYSWAPGPQELAYSYNGSPSIVVLDGVTNFQLGYESRSMPSAVQVPPYDSSQWGARWAQPLSGVVFEEFTEAKRSSGVLNISISKPAGSAEGHLLIAGVATDGYTANSLSAPAGWNLITRRSRSEEVSFGVWWKIAGASEPSSYQFTWNEEEKAYGWIMRFTGHDSVNPIHAWAEQTSTSNSPPSPAVTTTVTDTMILRLAGFDDDDIVVDDPGLPGHTAITMDESSSGTGTASGGAGFLGQPLVGDSGASTFSLTASEGAVAVTIAIAPDSN